jgi:4-hydroxybenzoate polyprenyltransferase
LATIKNYLSLVKFSHTIFALPFAIIGFMLGLAYKLQVHTDNIAGYGYSTIEAISDNDFLWSYGKIFLLVLICMVTARSAAMAFNRYLDRDFDAKNPRTAIREIPAGIISANSALWFTIANCSLFVLTTYFINAICFFLSPIALFVILFYSYTKRFTALCHLVLGVGLSLAPIGAYLAITGVFNWLPILFSCAVVFWVSGFDIIFALQDVVFDQSQQLHSIPAAVGKTKALRISETLHAISASFIIAAGIYGSFNGLYWAGVACFCGMLIYQHAIVQPNNLSRVNLAFMTANGIASVVFAAFVIADLWFYQF